MSVARLLPGVLKPLPSVALSAVRTPAGQRQVTSGTEPVRYGCVGGSYADMNVQCGKELDIFLGTWMLDKMTYPRTDWMSQKIRGQQIARSQPNLNAYIRFWKDEDMWRFETGRADTKTVCRYHFYLGVDFLMLYPSGKIMKTIVYPEDRILKWEQQNLEVPEDMLKVVTEVNGKKLTWKTSYPNGNKFIQKYIRQ